MTFTRSLYISLCVAALTVTCAQAAGLTFNITYTAAVQANPNFASIQNAVTFVEGEYSALYSDPITLNYTIDQNTSGLGESLFSNVYFRGSYTALRAALVSDAKTADDTTATSTTDLPLADPYNNGPTGWYAPSSEAKALGLRAANDAASDGTYTFNSLQTYTYDPNNRAVVGAFDFIGVTEHEFSELMGRVSQITNTGFGFDLLDTMRFTGAGVRNITPSTAGVHFSFDNGNTSLATYNAGPPGDLQDFDGSVLTDPFNASTGPNQAHALNSADIRELDVIGYDRITATGTPEPSTFLLGLPLLAIGLRRFRKSN